jgi:sulfur carrier protein ThiS
VVTVVLAGILTQYTGGRARLECAAGVTITEMLRALGIPSDLVAMALVDNRQVAKNVVPPDGATLTLLPLIGGG